ncbi:putative Mn2+ efflux pump MntP [Luteimonas sp. J16]|jgi:putative Mn2+ efflux pump MntP|uniref:manganese efflux pump MntP n=1 Tax=unclassified Luteimonas TaxID=2629088 RepID=UPI00047D09AA|nr:MULTISPECIES: manganese efflux pump MntP family protein [unclassified Luteimonas]TWG94365.1 putative Mn2+ efflux pump MntP [Luteimonas sp. J16]
MHPVSILLLGLALSTDAFAAAIGKGAAMRLRWPDALRTGAIFGVVEALTPLSGWALGSVAQRWIEEWDHWIAFGLLCGLGLHLVWKALHGDGAGDDAPRGTGLWAVAVAGLATSIDAMAVGVGLAFVDVNILLVATVIGLCTFTLVTIGVMAGRALGRMIGRRAEIVGGLVLIAVGTTILHQHLAG